MNLFLKMAGLKYRKPLNNTKAFAFPFGLFGIANLKFVKND